MNHTLHITYTFADAEGRVPRLLSAHFVDPNEAAPVVTYGSDVCTGRDYSRSLCATAERLVMHYRGSGDHLAPEEMAALVTFLRGRLAAWLIHQPADADYDNAIRAVVEAALAMHDQNEVAR